MHAGAPKQGENMIAFSVGQLCWKCEAEAR